jgi:hypothetical protein
MLSDFYHSYPYRFLSEIPFPVEPLHKYYNYFSIIDHPSSNTTSINKKYQHSKSIDVTFSYNYQEEEQKLSKIRKRIFLIIASVVSLFIHALFEGWMVGVTSFSLLIYFIVQIYLFNEAEKITRH